jgi:nucleoside-diphosphate-sugar epimerase
LNKIKQYFRGKKILVTGGAGAIGCNLTEALAKLDTKIVIVLDDLSSSKRWNVPSLPNVLFIKGSILDEVKLKRIFFEKPDYVFHLAAFFANQNSLDHPESDLMVNGIGTLKILEYCVLTDVKKFIYASSGCSIYGSNSPLPLREEFMSMHLSTPYQITKMLGELYCNFFFHHYNLKIVKTRFFNSYGPGEIPGQYRNVIPNFIFWALQKRTLPITGTGNETRDFTYVEDIVTGLLQAASVEEAIGEDINLASGRETKIIDLAKLINKITRNPKGIKFVAKRKWDTKNRLCASIKKAKKLLGYEPKTTFEQGLRNTIRWFKQNWDKIKDDARFPPGMSSAVRGYLDSGR